MDGNIILPEEIDLENDESEDGEYFFNFNEEEARRERAEVNKRICELHSQGLW